jgi:protein-S-isoprenylcysteine O-methyltransferase Ste14
MKSRKGFEREDVMHDRRTSWQRKTRRIPLFIGALLLVIFAKPQYPGILIGMVLIFLGEGIRIWAAGHLQKNEVLTVTGPYAYVKNPLYIGSILITAGFCILADSVYLLAAAFFMFCFHYIPYKKKVEGDRMKKIFGSQFEDYDGKVPDYLPRWTPYSNEKISWQFRCFIENSEEGILLIILAGIVLILSRPYWTLFF